MTKTLQTMCKTCFGGPRMILYTNWKKYFSKIEVWHFTTIRDSPPPQFGKRPDFFRFFFSAPFPKLCQGEKKCISIFCEITAHHLMFWGGIHLGNALCYFQFVKFPSLTTGENCIEELWNEKKIAHKSYETKRKDDGLKLHARVMKRSAPRKIDL